VDFTAVAGNLSHSFRVIAAARAGGAVCELPGVSIASAGVAFQMFNAAFLSQPVESAEELERRVVQAGVYFGAHGREWAYWVCEGLMDARTRRTARRYFERHGLRHSVDLPGMVADGLQPPARPLPEMEIQRVTGEPLRMAFCGIGSVCFHVPLPWLLEVYDNEAVFRDFACYVGFVDGEPVSTAAVVQGGGAMGVYNVATLPPHRRRGCGEAVMRHALEEAARQYGTRRVVLQSTPLGLRLYQRMGFRQVTSVAVYAS
jgi:ribosomal protein S18 acetylase RimI-like enzyme